MLPAPAPGCSDPRAINDGQSEACAYDCDALTTHFFPGQPQPRCFLFDRQSMSWPAELLQMRSERLDWRTYLEPNAATDPSSLRFTIGTGPTCTNVTIVTELLGAAVAGAENQKTEETRCLMDGKHEHDHVVTDLHTVEVVGYNSSGVRTGAGGTTTFVVGDCIDVLIRVRTSSPPSDGSAVGWEIDDGGHNGPWRFSSPPDVGEYEEVSCMFSNDFTLAKASAADPRR